MASKAAVSNKFTDKPYVLWRLNLDAGRGVPRGSLFSLKIFSILCLASIVLITGCTGNESSLHISAMELADQIESGDTPLILDTRSQYEYQNGHLPGAIYFPFWKAFFADSQILERCKKEPVIVYCQHGPRASFAGFALKRSGCDHILELDGHMAGWSKQGLPMTGETGISSTQTNH